MNLDGLTTRSTAGSGHGAWETRQREPPRPAVEVAVGSSEPRGRLLSCGYKALGRPTSLEHPFPSLSLLVHGPLLLRNLLVSSFGQAT